MEMKKYSCLAAIVMLMMIVTPAYSAAIDDWELPDAPKTDAQLYYDQIPIESKLPRALSFLDVASHATISFKSDLKFFQLNFISNMHFHRFIDQRDPRAFSLSDVI